MEERCEREEVMRDVMSLWGVGERWGMIVAIVSEIVVVKRRTLVECCNGHQR